MTSDAAAGGQPGFVALVLQRVSLCGRGGDQHTEQSEPR